ncbi:MAG: c-type cytochrome [Acidobacteriota bacterium]
MKLRVALVIVAAMAAIVAFRIVLGAPEALAAQQAQTVWDGIYTKEQAERGGSLFAQKCASCHGPDLGGGEMAPALTGSEFVWNWNGLSIGDLFERMRVSMPQDGPRKVSRKQKADILAFILSANKFPVGKRELASRTEMLRQIKFEALEQ